MPNHLAASISPYLLQHAHNPVDWYPWGEEAITRARTEDKPIFLSIGYAACHWCHVMAHESFEDPDVAAFMNEYFINIKVDREERPDLDGIYMQALVAMTGSGGWPMSVFLGPDLKPFYAGTYFPPVERYNMPSFRKILEGLVRAWQEDREEISRVGSQIIGHLQQQTTSNVSGKAFNQEILNGMASALFDGYDWGYGGWGSAPKFPQPLSLEFILRRALADPSRRAEFLKLITHNLRAMARGGMYDVVGGGFSRYSTDNFWRVPHFEKMLYDNSQLATIYLHSWLVTGDPTFRDVVEETLDFVLRELTHPDGGFHASLDADSEGEEGKFYVWRKEEIKDSLAEDSEFFEAAYSVTDRGNWDGKIVLQRALDDASLAARFKFDLETVRARLKDCHTRLLSARTLRIRPGTDDKVLTSWNGLMLATFAEAARYLDYSKYHIVATRSADFLLNLLRPDGHLRHAWRDGKTTSEVFLEDYAALIIGLVELYQTDFDVKWFNASQELADEMIIRFQDPFGGFFDTPSDGEVLPIRPKDMQDNAVPSGNALACEALLKLTALTHKGEYRDHADKTLALVVDSAMQYPPSFARWLSVADFALGPVKQIALVGEVREKTIEEMIHILRTDYRPNMVVASSDYPPPEGAPTLLADRPKVHNKSTAYVCEGFVCRQPVVTVEGLIKHL